MPLRQEAVEAWVAALVVSRGVTDCRERLFELYFRLDLVPLPDCVVQSLPTRPSLEVTLRSLLICTLIHQLSCCFELDAQGAGNVHMAR